MHIAFKIALYSYAITTVFNIILLPIKDYKKEKERDGKRRAIANFIGSFFLCFVPYIIFIMIICWEIGDLRKKMDKWIDKDPTSPMNVADPDFVPPPKKVEKVDPIVDRNEILDL